MIGLDILDRLTGGRLGTHDVPCPECGPLKRSAPGQRKRVLRIWRVEPNFASYYCARCGAKGYAREYCCSTPPDPMKLAKARAAAAQRERQITKQRLDLARWLWRRRHPIVGSIGELYLREARGYGGPLPATLGFLPSRGKHPPAMIAAFGLARETEPGVITISDQDVTGVHLTRLLPDGSGKAVFDDPDQNAKIMIGFSVGSPIVLAPPNDLLGLAITEGIEDGLSVHAATGLGVWCAGCASRMPKLVEAVPNWIDCVTVYAHADADGKRHALELADALVARGFEARVEGLA